jgi:hypothetical protein
MRFSHQVDLKRGFTTEEMVKGLLNPRGSFGRRRNSGVDPWNSRGGVCGVVGSDYGRPSTCRNGGVTVRVRAIKISARSLRCGIQELLLAFSAVAY